MRIAQFLNEPHGRAVGIIENDTVYVLDKVKTTYELFRRSEDEGISLEQAAEKLASGKTLDRGDLEKRNRFLVPLDHPDPYRLWITGTGLTHLGSAASRNAMHKKSAEDDEKLTDSMKMFRMGLENGKMEGDRPGAQPEWFYKGNGLIAVSPGQPLESPSFALDGGEEPEIAGLYIVDKKGRPVNIGYCLGNEFSDHDMEKINYLYLAHSKLRPCSYGPELITGPMPGNISGTSRIIREGKTLWQKEFLTGEDNMSHNLANLAHHHFKYALFRQPGDAHVHFLGASALSCLDNIRTRDGDIFSIEADYFGTPLVNPLKVD
ncbi:MAG: hypothetical protein JNL51_11850 [Chitinophagaceae bacterium]|nr:hypothetical protein [Chitinophagaceae bacterium]